ncbi:2-oxoglutarate-dependent dioxygenase [Candidatus Methylospira mobilis]|uniref:2-oxoglutarate-dependent dioxygenase n=1 Tax=Candidatus Methylospira mobilis TaxID=1808979 RepID=A0A5Q0BLZ8_9GAMM|nr:2OG-Fe(II) oxygenase [Candidatus Methylospira mobilis]QFY43244.1 2-oxoglutarate-dependent dioxygenase [Candidatus Methylospira mobilis]
MTTVDGVQPAWHDWIVTNLRRGCNRQSMIESMVQAQFDAAFASTCIECIAKDMKNGASSRLSPSEPYRYEAGRIASGNIIALSDFTVKVAFRLNRPDVVLLEGFMSNAECDELVALSRQKLLPSTIVDPQSGDTKIIAARSSEGTYFQRGENELVRRLERRMSELMNWPVERGEGIQILYYRVGAEYRPHFDYFPVQDPGSAPHLAKGGQRVATLVMYLNDVADGGGTFFPNIGLNVTPLCGSALYFAYANSMSQVDPATLHGGSPVLAGEKWIATKWLRQNQYGG